MKPKHVCLPRRNGDLLKTCGYGNLDKPPITQDRVGTVRSITSKPRPSRQSDLMSTSNHSAVVSDLLPICRSSL